jgi:hypothetical protein
MASPPSDSNVVFHVQVKRSHHRANVFNLDAATVRAAVVEPWLGRVPLRLGDREWPPEHSSLRILEGARLPPADLAHGQGWKRAESAGRDVTRELLAGPATALVLVVAEADAAQTGRELVAALDATFGDWAAVREDLLAGSEPPAATVLVLVPAAPSPGWLFDAGLAVGAFGARAIFVAAAAGAPANVAGRPVLAAAGEEQVAGLRERLLLP